MPLAVVGRVNRYRPSRVARLAAMAGTAHVVFSLLLGAVIVLIGLQFRTSIESAQDTIVGSILLLTAALFLGLELAGRGHPHGPGEHTHDHPHAHDGLDHDGHAHHHDDHDHPHGHEHGVAAVTGYKLEGNWLDRWGNLITAGVLLVIGALVITHVI